MGEEKHTKLLLALGTMKDQASISKAMIFHHYNKSFSDIQIAVFRATAHHFSLIDDKNMHQILFLASNSPGSIPFLAECLSRRLAKTRNHVVATKTLLLLHRLLRGGNRCFEQQLCSTHVSGHLQMSSPWFLRCSDPLACFLHKYASYLEERIGWVINQAGKLEPVKSPGSNFQRYDEKAVDVVLLEVPKCQVFMDKVIECCLISDNLLSHHLLRLAQAAMTNILKESFQVYSMYCEGVAALMNVFFDLTNPARAMICEILKKASQQSKELEDLYQNCRRMMGKNNLEYPSVQIISMEHVLALEKCCDCNGGRLWEVPAKAAEWEFPAAEGKDDLRSPENIFSCRLETKISKVWVVFED